MGGLLTVTSSYVRVALQIALLRISFLKYVFVSNYFSGADTEGAIFEDRRVAL